jgi:hypothetical protein
MTTSAPAVFNRGCSSPSSCTIYHAPPEPSTTSNPTRSKDDKATTPISFLRRSPTFFQASTTTPVLALAAAYTSFHPPPTTALMARQRAKSHRSFIYQWLPPPCQTSCFFVTGHMLVFPGFSSILPTLLLEKELPYVYECICVKGSGQVDAPTLENVSQCSTTVNHLMP